RIGHPRQVEELLHTARAELPPQLREFPLHVIFRRHRRQNDTVLAEIFEANVDGALVAAQILGYRPAQTRNRSALRGVTRSRTESGETDLSRVQCPCQELAFTPLKLQTEGGIVTLRPPILRQELGSSDDVTQRGRIGTRLTRFAGGQQ